MLLDKERHFKLTLGGMKVFQRETGKSLLKGFNIAEMNEAELITFIWACLVWEDKNLSLEDFGYLLDVSQLSEITVKLTAAIETASPKGTANPNPASLPTG
jgi:hypothetical protein